MNVTSCLCSYVVYLSYFFTVFMSNGQLLKPFFDVGELLARLTEIFVTWASKTNNSGK